MLQISFPIALLRVVAVIVAAGAVLLFYHEGAHVLSRWSVAQFLGTVLGLSVGPAVGAIIGAGITYVTIRQAEDRLRRTEIGAYVGIAVIAGALLYGAHHMKARAADVFTGEMLYIVCRDNPKTCAKIVRDHLIRKGWPEQVAFNALIRDTKQMEWMACPQRWDDGVIANGYIDYWRARPARLKQTMMLASIVEAMAQSAPDCATASTN